MLTTIEGVYKNGKIELFETPPGVQESNVVVTFLPTTKKTAGTMIPFGMFKELMNVTEDDFSDPQLSGTRC